MNVDFYRDLARVAGLEGVELTAGTEGDIVTACAWCHRIYAVCDAAGAPGGISSGMCATRVAGLDCTRVDPIDALLDEIYGEDAA